MGDHEASPEAGGATVSVPSAFSEITPFTTAPSLMMRSVTTEVSVTFHTALPERVRVTPHQVP